MIRRLFSLALILSALTMSSMSARSADLWQTLPPTPKPVVADRGGEAAINGISIHYGVYGKGAPVILLHGGLANGDYWGHQITALMPNHMVIVMDSRGHGRSTRDPRAFGYDLRADDVVALMDMLGVRKADIVGWSDGGIIGLDLALRHKSRVGKVFAFAANSLTSGVRDGVEKNPTFAAYIERAGHEYEAHSATPKAYDDFVTQISKMWSEQPNWTDGQLQSIEAPVWIVDGDHDEAIRREHTEYLAATIPHAGLLILPNASHFAFLQDPDMFNRAMIRFLDGK
jgi:pimeloyl-ACP methyl ester carboxylesterase